MSSKKLNRLLTGLLVALLIGIFGVAYAINGLLEGQSSRLVSAKTKLTALQQEQSQLVQLKKDIKTYNDLYQIAQVIVPQNKDQTEAVRQIVDLASANNVSLAEISFPPSTLGSVSSTSGVGAGSSTPTSAGSVAPGLSQLIAVPKIPGVYELELSVTSGSNQTYPDMIGFLAGLEQNRLTAQVGSISITPSAQDPSLLSFILELDVYIKPGSA
jgi:hypothetical protein